MGTCINEISKNKHESNLKLSIIIIPVYNTERYVGECLDSCEDQDIPKSEYEIICVDDGSTDISLKVLNEYSEKCSNIHVYSQKNQGVSAARNTGIGIAQGKYIWFVDSDDYIALNCLKTLLDAMKKYNAETCMFSMLGVSQDSSIYTISRDAKIKSITVVNKRKSANTVWNVLYLRQILIKQNIRFSLDMTHGEDTFFSYMYSLYSNDNRTIQIEGILYYYRKRIGSATNTKTIEMTEKYVYSMKAMAIKYKQTLDNGSVPKRITKEVQNRVKLSVAAAMFSAGRNKKYDSNKLISELKSFGLYPYQLYWGSLKPSVSFKHTVIEWIKFFFPFEPYYKLYTYIIRKFN